MTKTKKSQVTKARVIGTSSSRTKATVMFWVGRLSEARSPVAPAPRVGDPQLQEEQRAPGKDNINFEGSTDKQGNWTKNITVEESWRMIDPQRKEREECIWRNRNYIMRSRWLSRCQPWALMWDKLHLAGAIQAFYEDHHRSNTKRSPSRDWNTIL